MVESESSKNLERKKYHDSSISINNSSTIDKRRVHAIMLDFVKWPKQPNNNGWRPYTHVAMPYIQPASITVFSVSLYL